MPVLSHQLITQSQNGPSLMWATSQTSPCVVPKRELASSLFRRTQLSIAPDVLASLLALHHQ